MVGMRAIVDEPGDGVVPANHFRLASPTRHRYRAPLHDIFGVPRGYPGAKLARKAMNGTVGKATLR